MDCSAFSLSRARLDERTCARLLETPSIRASDIASAPALAHRTGIAIGTAQRPLRREALGLADADLVPILLPVGFVNSVVGICGEIVNRGLRHFDRNFEERGTAESDSSGCVSGHR
jgi:hypothetical protein